MTEEQVLINHIQEYLDSGMWQYEACYLNRSDLKVIIKALEQELILDKIRAEIDVARFIDKDTKLCKNANASGLEIAMQIIDKYKAGSDKE